METSNKYEPYIINWIDDLIKLQVGERICKSRDDFSSFITQDMSRTAIGFNKCFFAGEMPFCAYISEKPRKICIKKLEKFDKSIIYNAQKDWRAKYPQSHPQFGIKPIKGQRDRMKKMLAEKGITF